MEKKLKALLKNGEFDGVLEKTKNTMSSIRGKGNKSTERRLRMLLIRHSIKGWKLHNPKIKGKPDFYFPNQKVAIFVDGCFWHGCPQCGHIPKTRSDFWRAKIERNIERDKSINESLKQDGILILRFWEHEFKNKENVPKIINDIKNTLLKRGPTSE